VRDRALIRLREAYSARRYVQKDRIACEQRLYQQVIGRIFLTEDGRYPEGLIEDAYDQAKANDRILTTLIEEEAVRERELKKVIQKLPIWKELFEKIEGCGEVLAAGIVAAAGDIRRFATPAKLKAYLGVHLLPDGSFPRKRLGKVANWKNEGRQALFLLSEQFNYRPDSEWGKKLRKFKQNYRARHPKVVEVEGKKRYTDAHIHKTGRWRTLTRFVERLWKDWTKLEKAA
ncbi:MAG: transposase, partial [Patescibacteria group bacterium]